LPHCTPYIENFSICEACNWKKQELSTDKPAMQRTINKSIKKWIRVRTYH
jgi:C4-type Zn-finger protein